MKLTNLLLKKKKKKKACPPRSFKERYMCVTPGGKSYLPRGHLIIKYIGKSGLQRRPSASGAMIPHNQLCKLIMRYIPIWDLCSAKERLQKPGKARDLAIMKIRH